MTRIYDKTPRGEAQALAKMTTADVHAIRRLSAQGFTRVDISRRYQVDPTTVFNIVHRKTWAHVPDEDVSCP